MKLKDLMAGRTPDPSFEGFITNDDFVLAVGIDDKPSEDPGDYEVVEMGITGLDSNMNPITKDNQYLRAGQSTLKSGNQRTFSITGDRYAGDPFQDWAFSHKTKYGTGSEVIRPYVYFHIQSGKGEKGTASIIINSDGSGSAGENAGIDIEIRSVSQMPVEFIYTPAGGDTPAPASLKKYPADDSSLDV